MSDIRKHALQIVVILTMVLYLLPLQVFAAHVPTTGVSVEVSNASSNSMGSDGAITVTAKGRNPILGMGGSIKTATITITNSGATKAKISCAITKTEVNLLTASAGTLNDGSFSHTLNAEESVTLTLTTAKNSTENKVVLSAFRYEEVSDNATATVTYDSAKGSVTLGGSAVASGGSATATDGTLAAVATPASGCSFLGWVNTATREILATAASTTLDVPQNMDIQAVFVNKTSDTAWFSVDGKYLVDNLTTAGSKGTKIVLANNGTLASGTYTIVSGDTLLIPNDSAHTVYTTTPGHDGEDTYTAPSVYRKLTLASGANITVDGAISIAGKVGTNLAGKDASGNIRVTNGAPSGPLGFIDMASGSTITVNSGANLYAWGYIIGSGSVEVKSGGTVHEDFQVTDWRGGTVTSRMVGNKQQVFPLSQYYVQNIQVPLKLNAGAKEKVVSAMSITLVGVQMPNPEFIGSDGLFNVVSGSMIKDYDEGTDRTIFTVNGDISIANLAITLNAGILAGNITINSQDYVLPIRSGMVINMESGNLNVTQNMSILPGAEFNIEEGVTVTMGKGYSLYVYDADNWGKFCYNNASLQDATYNPVIYVPTGRADRSAGLATDAKMKIDGTFDASEGGFYTTPGGADIYSEKTGRIDMGENTGKETYQYSQIADSSDGYGKEVYISVPIVPAKLKNADGTYLSSVTDTYNYVNDAWNCTNHPYDEGVETTAPGCVTEGLTTYTCTVCSGTKTESIEAKGHSYTEEITTPAGCETEGVKTFTCANCGDKYTEAIPALEHKDDDKDHVCDNKCGVYQGTHADSGTDGDHVCDYGCGAVLEDCADVTTDKDHSCDVCGKADVTVHVYTEAVTPPTCTEDGFTTHTCNCGHTYTDNTVKAQHSIAQGAAQEKTCTQDGWEAYEYCTKCSHSTKVVIPAGHTLKFVEEKAASCTEAGNVAHWLCDVCGKCFADEQAKREIADVTVPATNHANAKTINASEATCGEDGYTGDTYCEDCNTTIATGTSIPATGAHEYDEGVVTQEPTATVPGVMTYTCGTCGDSYTKEIPATGVQLEIIIHDVPKKETNGIEVKAEAENGVMTVVTRNSDNSVVSAKYVHLIKCTLDNGSVETLKNTSGNHLDGTYAIPEGAVSVEIESAMLGDANGDGNIAVDDANLISLHLAKKITLDGLYLITADANTDAYVAVDDANSVSLHLAKKVLLF